MLSGFVSFLITLISIPLALRYLGAEQYGLWATAASLATMAAFADLGIGNGLLNAISQSHGTNDEEAARRYVSSAFFALTGIALVLGLVFVLAYPYVPWGRLFNVSPRSFGEASMAAAVVAGFWLVSIPLGVAQRIEMGYQEGFTASIWNVAGRLAGLVGLLIAVAIGAQFGWVIIALAGGPAFGAFLNFIVSFGFKRPRLRPRLSLVTKKETSFIVNVGLLFFALQIGAAIGYHSDNIVIARLLGANEVTQYAVPFSLFALLPKVLSYILMPLWPAYGESIARGDMDWVRHAFHRSIITALGITVPIVTLLVVFGGSILPAWAGPGIRPSFSLLITLGAWAILASVGGPFAMLLNGANLLRFQVIQSVLMASSNLALSIYLVQRIGVTGAILGTVISQVLFILIPSGFYISRRVLR